MQASDLLPGPHWLHCQDMVHMLRLLDYPAIANTPASKVELHAAISSSILKLVEALDDTSDDLPPGEPLLIIISHTEICTINHTVLICP